MYYLIIAAFVLGYTISSYKKQFVIDTKILQLVTLINSISSYFKPIGNIKISDNRKIGTIIHNDTQLNFRLLKSKEIITISNGVKFGKYSGYYYGLDITPVSLGYEELTVAINLIGYTDYFVVNKDDLVYDILKKRLEDIKNGSFLKEPAVNKEINLEDCEESMAQD